MRLFILLGVTLWAGLLRADSSPTLLTMPPPPPANIADMKLGQLYFSYRTLALDEWQNGPEKRILNLFPGFRDGSNVGRFSSHDIVLFIARSSMVTATPIDSRDLQATMDIRVIQRLLSGFADVTPISPNDVETYKKDLFAYRNPPNRHWCSGDSVLCLNANYVLDIQAKIVLAGLLFLKEHTADSELRSQGEVRIETPVDEKEATDVKSLTSIATEPTGLIIQNSFWFSHAIEFAKVVGVVQPHPQNSNQSIISGFAIFAVERKWWDLSFHGMALHEVFLGNHLNGTTGLSMGFPRVTVQLFDSLAKILTRDEESAGKLPVSEPTGNSNH